jgi:ABC-type branched-subunit amino acid transport system permease subunit
MAFEFYFLTIATFFVIYNILTWGLNIQFGLAGIPDFAYIAFMAIGAYFAGVTSLPRSTEPLFVHYILGLSWPFPVTLLAGAIAAAGVGALFGVIALRRLRDNYLAIVTFSLGFITYDFVSSYVPLFNGFQGLAGVAPPASTVVHLSYNDYQWLFLAIATTTMVVLGLGAWHISRSPLGRTMRAVRDNIDVAESLGKNTFRVRLAAFVIGCFYAGVGGALTIEYIGAFNPSAWQAPETFIIWAALLIGGRANSLGVVIGSLLVPICLFEVTTLVPLFNHHPQTSEGLRLMGVGVLIIAVLWFRPEGILPERKRFYEIAIPTSEPRA